MKQMDLNEADFDKQGGLIPAIVQHSQTAEVLMLGYMNREALAKTLNTSLVTFYSRSRDTLWTKGETSGNTLTLTSIKLDCDKDTFLVEVCPKGPTCHTGTNSCFGDDVPTSISFLSRLSSLIEARAGANPDSSYTAKLLSGPRERAAQKVGEEGVETTIAALTQDDNALIGEAADLIYHLMVLLRTRGIGIDAIVKQLSDRHTS